MNHFKAFFLIALLGIVVFSCKKDISEAFSGGKSGGNGFVSYNWSPDEASFFDFNRGAISATERSSSDFHFHPLIIQAYNEIALQNEEYNFIEPLVKRTGLPLWRDVYVHHNPSNDENLVMIPAALQGQSTLSSVILVNQRVVNNNQDFAINAYSRQELLQVESGIALQKLAVTRWMLRYERRKFGTTDQALLDAYCSYKSAVGPVEGGIEGGGPNPTPPPVLNCEWRVAEICTDWETHTSWVSGYGEIPPHLDHDHDGVPNCDDQDWNDFIARTGLTQEEFTDLVFEIWNDKYDDRYGDYDDFFNQFEDEPDPFGGEDVNGGSPFGQDFMELWDILVEFWLDLGDIIRNDGYLHEDNPLDPLESDPDYYGDDKCDNGGGLATADDRTCYCDYYYILACGDDWWNNIVETVPCPECPSYQDIARDHLYPHWDWAYEGNVDFFDFENFIGQSSGCSAFSPEYLDCVDAFVSNFVSNSIVVAPSDLPALSSGVADCFKECNGTQGVPSTQWVTICVDQPKPSTRSTWTIFEESDNSSGKELSDIDVGHTFIVVEQLYGAAWNIMSIGFYPSNGISPNNPQGGGEVTYDDEHSFDVSIRYEITCTQLNNLLSSIQNVLNNDPDYNLNSYNCTNFALETMKSIGINLPVSIASWPGGGGANPGCLGEDLRAISLPGNATRNLTGGQAPHSTCE